MFKKDKLLKQIKDQIEQDVSTWWKDYVDPEKREEDKVELKTIEEMKERYEQDTIDCLWSKGMTLKWYFFRWLRGPANIANGIVQTLTGGMYEPSWSFRAECKFLDVAESEAVHNAPELSRAILAQDKTDTA